MSTELETLIAEKTRRLHQRQLQEARMGYSTPPEVLMEIEDLKAEIKTLKTQQKALSRPVDNLTPTEPPTPQPDWREKRRAELAGPLETYHKRITALRQDIARELNGQRKVVLEEELAEAKTERDKLQAELDALDA